MSDTSGDGGLAAAEARLDKALRALKSTIGDTDQKLGQMAAIQADRQKLASDRARLSQEADRANARARALDESAAQVSRRLVDAMETIKTVLSK